jgi:hypothetical protein
MNERANHRALVHLVGNGLRQQCPESELVSQLIAAGIPKGEASLMLARVRAMIQAGVQAEFTGGLSAPDGPPADPFLAEAFRYGQESYRGGVRQAWLQRLAFPVGVLILVVAILVGWRLSR